MNKNVLSRRHLFYSALGLAGGSLLSKDMRLRLADLLCGEAFASSLQENYSGRYYLEIGLRDQWDFGHVFVPPGIGSHPDLIQGEGDRQAALFFPRDKLIDMRSSHNLFLTPDSAVLAPHMDHIAIIETCELPIGVAHGHEASCAMRIPGRIAEKRAGFMPTWVNDGIGQEFGNQRHYGNCPTLTCLHNYNQKNLAVDASPNNGIYLFGNGIVDHKVNQFDFDLSGAKLDRFSDIASLEAHLDLLSKNILNDANEARHLIALLKKLDSHQLTQSGFGDALIKEHHKNLDAASGALFNRSRQNRNLRLSTEERRIWNDNVLPHNLPFGMEFGEMAGYAAHLIKHDVTRSIALAFDHDDIHGPRREASVTTEGKQFSEVFARLIATMKQDGTFDKTIIAAYTVDGGRGVQSLSYGNEGKNTVVLAGGAIKGGYYGDIRVGGNNGDGHDFIYFAPDAETGQVRSTPAGTTTNSNRIMGDQVWVTVAQLLGIKQYDYEPVKKSQPLKFLMRS